MLSAASARRFTSPAVAAPDFGADAKYAMGLAGFAIDDGPVLHHAQFLPPDETVGLVARSLTAGYVGGLVSQGLV